MRECTLHNGSRRAGALQRGLGSYVAGLLNARVQGARVEGGWEGGWQPRGWEYEPELRLAFFGVPKVKLYSYGRLRNYVNSVERARLDTRV
jgi:hypothetical protein